MKKFGYIHPSEHSEIGFKDWVGNLIDYMWDL